MDIHFSVLIIVRMNNLHYNIYIIVCSNHIFKDAFIYPFFLFKFNILDILSKPLHIRAHGFII